MSTKLPNTVIDVYQRHGQAWSNLRSDNLVEGAWLDRFCQQLPAKADVLDIGCGSGLPIARELTARNFHVTGVDGSSTMLAMFRRNLPESPVHHSDMRQFDLGRRYAGLLAWDSFFHLSPDDQRAMFPRLAAHAVPGAALMFTSGVTEGHAIGELEGEPLYHGSLSSHEYRMLLADHGFEVLQHIIEDPTCGLRTVWLARKN